MIFWSRCCESCARGTVAARLKARALMVSAAGSLRRMCGLLSGRVDKRHEGVVFARAALLMFEAYTKYNRMTQRGRRFRQGYGDDPFFTFPTFGQHRRVVCVSRTKFVKLYKLCGGQFMLGFPHQESGRREQLRREDDDEFLRPGVVVKPHV